MSSFKRRMAACQAIEQALHLSKKYKAIRTMKGMSKSTRKLITDECMSQARSKAYRLPTECFVPSYQSPKEQPRKGATRTIYQKLEEGKVITNQFKRKSGKRATYASLRENNTLINQHFLANYAKSQSHIPSNPLTASVVSQESLGSEVRAQEAPPHARSHKIISNSTRATTVSAIKAGTNKPRIGNNKHPTATASTMGPEDSSVTESRSGTKTMQPNLKASEAIRFAGKQIQLIHDKLLQWNIGPTTRVMPFVKALEPGTHFCHLPDASCLSLTYQPAHNQIVRYLTHHATKCLIVQPAAIYLQDLTSAFHIPCQFIITQKGVRRQEFTLQPSDYIHNAARLRVIIHLEA